MKKLVLILMLIAFTTPSVVSCTPENKVDDQEQATGHGEVGDPGDDDDEEGGN